ncbi:AzlD domain-containing protein [Maribrevibacterium harenarium]|uniref:AzlD domain-containing protein n=1 Tax=Maribrevibacterium harenarium TaxID=2589817 RepID=A0A501W696_9GAMM|nr:AzlD domain-containing protein [Maribrevibacterium harenarium]TPE44155.1 AzlD domain-containing protein [Maribrevibacterium harenarium]
MNGELWIAMLAIAAGTYLLRLVPYVWMRNKLARQAVSGAQPSMPTWLTILGPTMIAALFGISLAPVTNSTTAWVATAAGITATYLTWRKTRSMGIPILVGVVMFGVVLNGIP